MPASSSVSPLPPTATSLGEAADAAAASTARAVADAPASGSAWSCARLRWRFLSRLVSSLALTGTEGGGGIDAELNELAGVQVDSNALSLRRWSLLYYFRSDTAASGGGGSGGGGGGGGGSGSGGSSSSSGGSSGGGSGSEQQRQPGGATHTQLQSAGRVVGGFFLLRA